jgi:uncharacterized protein YjiS (DUF1127 family)
VNTRVAVTVRKVIKGAAILFGRLVAAKREVFRVGDMVAELELLDDHMLRDIGLTRYDIAYVARDKNRELKDLGMNRSGIESTVRIGALNGRLPSHSMEPRQVVTNG